MTSTDRQVGRAISIDGSVVDSDLLGGKGSSLARLVQSGFPVPLTAVVTTQAYRDFVTDDRLQEMIEMLRRTKASVPGDVVDEAFLDAPMPSRLADEILRQARMVAAGSPLAIRSSATTEDLPHLSFAGQFRSFLNISGDENVLRAVRLSWASLWHPAPLAYRRAWDLLHLDPAMAVVIMRMVPAKLAGVAFTRDPGGDPALLRIESVEGLADSLVSGDRTPDVWLMPRDPANRPKPVPSEVAAVAELAAKVEQAFGSAQDIEWASDGQQVWLVQSRPITVTAGATSDGFDSPSIEAELTTEGIAEMLPGVLPPLLWEINSFLVEEAFRNVLDDLAVMPASLVGPHAFIRRVRGRAAMDLDLLRSIAGALPGGSAGELERQYFGTADLGGDEGRKRGGVAGPLYDMRAASTRHRAHLESDIVVAAVDQAMTARPVIADLDNVALFAYWQRLVEFAARTTTAEMTVAASAAAAYHRLEATLTRYLGSMASGVVQELATGAAMPPPPDAAASRSLFGGPTWLEAADARPSPLPPSRVTDGSRLRGLERKLQSDRKWRRTRILTAQFVDVRIHLLRRLADDARDGLARREQVKAALLRLGGEVRSVHLELGRRLVADGILGSAADVELLGVAELSAALAGRGPDRPALAGRRRWLTRYESDGPLPQRFAGPPSRARVTSKGHRLVGWAASPGTYVGRARAVTGPADGVLQPGEVLVAEATDPGWTNLFLQAGALVVERGGPLSHAAIVARELGIPAVLNVPGAATRLDGCLVTVDGDAGVVLVHPDEDEVSR